MAERYEDRYRNDRDEHRGDRPGRYEGRGFIERAGDELRSWFGDEEAERRRRMDERWDRWYEADPEFRRWRDRDFPERSSVGERWSGDDRSAGYGRWAYDRPYDRTPDAFRRGAGGDRGYTRPAGPAGEWHQPWYARDDRSRGYGAEFGERRDWPHRREGFAGRGPKGYQRSDARISEDVCDRLADAPEIDATHIEVKVANGEVTLSGSVPERWVKRRSEEIIENISGVREVHNHLRVGEPAQPVTGATPASGGFAGAGRP